MSNIINLASGRLGKVDNKRGRKARNKDYRIRAITRIEASLVNWDCRANNSPKDSKPFNRSKQGGKIGPAPTTKP